MFEIIKTPFRHTERTDNSVRHTERPDNSVRHTERTDNSIRHTERTDNSVRHTVKAVLNWAEHSVREQLCLLEMFKLAVPFLIDVFDLGEQLCSRPVGRRSDVRNIPSAGYGSMLLIG